MMSSKFFLMGPSSIHRQDALKSILASMNSVRQLFIGMSKKCMVHISNDTYRILGNSCNGVSIVDMTNDEIAAVLAGHDLSKYHGDIYGSDDLLIDDDEVMEMVQRIKPVVLKEGILRYIEIPDRVRNTAFTWSPTYLEEASLTPYAFIKTVHEYAAREYFKPSIDEVFAQIRSEKDFAVAFSTSMDGLNGDDQFTCGGERHMAITTLYRKA